MQMIRQYNERVDVEGISLARLSRRFAQRVNLVDEKRFSAIEHIDGEEPAPAGNERAAIIRHVGFTKCRAQ
jgi:hypothetical protein